MSIEKWHKKLLVLVLSAQLGLPVTANAELPFVSAHSTAVATPFAMVPSHLPSTSIRQSMTLPINQSDNETSIGQGFLRQLGLEGITWDEFKDATFEAFQQLHRDAKGSMVWKATSLLWLNLDSMDSGSAQLFQYYADAYYARDTKWYFTPFGVFAKSSEVDQYELLKAFGNLSVFALSAVPTTKFLGKAVRFVRFKWLSNLISGTAEKTGTRLLAEGEVKLIQKSLIEMGENELAAQVIRRRSVKSILQLLKPGTRGLEAEIRKWAINMAIVQGLARVGFKLPAKPSNFTSSAEWAKFALTQGALILAGDTTNPTTAVISRTGQEAKHIILAAVSKLEPEQYQTTEDLVADKVTLQVPGAPQGMHPADVSKMTDEEALSNVQATLNADGSVEIRRVIR